MPLKYFKFGIGIALFIGIFCVQPVQANAPDVKVHVVVENSGSLMPVGGAYVRWRNKCGGSYKYKCEYTDQAKAPRRYGRTTIDGSYLYIKFQAANMSKEYNTILENFTDADYPGQVRMVNAAGAKFGCGQDNNKLAVTAEGYTCDEYKLGAPSTNKNDYKKISCTNGWCEGDLSFEDDCTNGCPLKEYTFKCKGQSITNAREVKANEVGLSATTNWAFGCTQAHFCSDPSTTTAPVPTGQKSNYTTCANYASTASGPVKKRVKLSGMQSLYDKSYIQKQSEGIPAYIVECINLNGKYQCTSGNSSMDTTIFGKNNVPSGYFIEMFKSSTNKPLTNPVTYQQLDEDIVAISTYTAPISSFFMLVYPEDKQTAVNVGSASGQQQATLHNSSDCRILQDPYGRVFDSHTMEPLSNASVELTKKGTKGSYSKVTTSDTLVQIQNPQTTKEDGKFAFNVIDGIYKLAAEKAGYIRATTQDIIQQGKAVRVDIPLTPLDKQAAEEYAKTNPVKILNYLQSINKETKTYRIEGDVTHAHAMVVVFSNVLVKNGEKVRGEALARTDADLTGHFVLTFPISKIKENQTVGELVAIKKNYGIKDQVMLEPIFDSVKGYAYDNADNLIPGAKVEVMVPFSTIPVYQTTADAKGYFRINADMLPPLEYSFIFTSLSGNKDVVSTLSFSSQNKTYSNFALNTDANTAVLGAYASDNSMAAGEETVDANSKILIGAFIILLLMAIPLSRMYNDRDGKRKKKS